MSGQRLEVCDIVVFASTPCGIAAALAAARYGRQVALVSKGEHVGGLMASGLSITDLRFRWAFGAIFDEFARNVRTYYAERYGEQSEQVEQCNGGFWFEPHVAERVFDDMLRAEPNVRVWRGMELKEAVVREDRLEEAVFQYTVDLAVGEERRAQAAFRATVFIDASYEGDLAARAGVPFRAGRESREDYGEPYGGFIFLRNPGLQVLDGSTGAGDERVQAYNYRLCLTNRDDLRVPPVKPADYARDEYAPLVALCNEGKLRTLNDIIRLAPIPNGKYNGNNRPIVRSLDLPEANTAYPDGDERTRAAIRQQYEDYMTGLLWFVQNDPELSEELREEARTWGFCRDEFADNRHIPYELYVREARRIVGRKTFTAHDASLAPGSERTPSHEDAVAVGDYHVDSHVVQRQRPGWPQIEGHVYLRALSKPAQIPFGVIVPERIRGLLVPGAMSATHLGFSVLRMEPPWMALGQAAGAAAHLALEMGVEAGDVPVAALQRMLLEAGQVISFFYDVPGPDPIWAMLNKPEERTRQDVQIETAPADAPPSGLQYYGARGFFQSYYARPSDPLTRAEAVPWLYDYMRREGLHAGLASAAEASAAEASAEASVAGVAELHASGKRYASDERHASGERQGSGDQHASGELQGSGEGASRYRDIGADYPHAGQLAELDRLGVLEPWRGTDGYYPAAAVARGDAARWVARDRQRP